MQRLVNDCDLDPTARPTPLPPYDVGAFARDSESGLRALPELELDTSPPPALHPASLPAIPRPPPLPQRLTSSVQSQMTECARRADLLATTLRVGAISREEASRTLRTELDALEECARDEALGPLRAFALRLRDVIEELGGITEEPPAIGRELLVLDADPATGALLAIAIETHGQFVRTASSLPELVRFRGVDFGAIFVAMDFPGADPTQPFCRMLREIVRSETVPVIVYGRASELRLDAFAERVEASGALRIDMGVDELLGATGLLLAKLAAQE